MAFGAIKAVNDVMELIIKEFVHAADIFAGGIAIIAAGAVSVWFLYRCYLIMSGQVPDPMLPLIRDFAFKIAILTLAGATAGSAALYQDSIGNTLRETPIEMGKAITKENNIYDFFDKKFDEIEQINIDTSHNNSHWWQINDKIDGLIEFAKIFVIYIGFIILALVATVIFIIEKTFFMLAIGFGIFFIAFLAFDYTRQWFNTWLASTIGYGMSYVVIVFVLATLFKNIDAVFALPEKGEITWGRSFGFLFICIFFAVIISRLGDLVSGWFGASNITDGTALAGLGAASFTGNVGLKGAAYTAFGVKGVSQLTGKGVSKVYNHFKKPSIKAGSSNSGNLKTNANPKTNTNKPTNSNANTKGNTPSSSNNSGNLKGSSGSGNKGQSSGGSGANHTPRPRNTATHPPKLNNNRKK